MKAILVMLALGCGSSAAAQLVISAGTPFSLKDSTRLTLNNTDLVNNGIFTAGAGRISFTGNALSVIDGTQPLQFHMLEINKSNAAGLMLEKDISVSESIVFSSGMLQLSSHNIDLGSTGMLIGEKEISRITGVNGGEVIANMNLDKPVSANPGNLGAIISSPGYSGNVIIKRGHLPQTNNFGNGLTIQRYYTIIAGNNASLNATLRFHYFDGELNGLPESLLSLWQSANNTSWTNTGFTSFDTTANYVEKTGIASFARFTLSSVSNSLPVQFVLVNLQCQAANPVLNWKTAQEQNSSRFTIEASTNALHWKTVGTVPAAGNSTVERSYSFTDKNPAQNIYYRIVQYDLDGSAHYTQVIKSACRTTDRFSAWPNPFHDKIFLNIAANASSEVLIKIYDANSVLVKTKKQVVLAGMNNASIDMPDGAAGTYTIITEWKEEKEIKVVQVVKL